MRKGYSYLQKQSDLCKIYEIDVNGEIKDAEFPEGKSEFRHKHWSFIQYSHDRVAYLFRNWKKCFAAPEIPSGVRQAYEQELSLLEVCTGNYEEPDYIPITADLDVEPLKRKWHWEYCHYHRYHRSFIRKEFLRPYVSRRAFIPAPIGRSVDE